MSLIKVTPADKAFSDYIRTRDKWTCQRCGGYYDPLISEKRQGLHCSHFMGRGRHSTRLDERNADALCYGCHRYFTAHPADHYEWQVQRKGQELVDELRRISNQPKKLDIKAEAKYWRGRLATIQ